jgi:hypothetical protein
MNQELCPLCEGDHLETCHIDGDWTVKFYFDSCLIQTGVIAGSKEQAIRFAEVKIADELGLEMIVINSPEEVVVELVGVYA